MQRQIAFGSKAFAVVSDTFVVYDEADVDFGSQLLKLAILEFFIDGNPTARSHPPLHTSPINGSL